LDFVNEEVEGVETGLIRILVELDSNFAQVLGDAKFRISPCFLHTLEILEAHPLIKQKWRRIIILQIILLTNLLELAVGQYFGGIEVIYFTISSGYFEDLIELKHFEPIS